MESSSDLASRLTDASRRKLWNVYEAFDWPQRLSEDLWYMPPELISIYGTELWETLDEAQLRKLSLYEIGNFFSFVLHGERPLVQGLVHRLYSKQNSNAVTEYLHHFVDEENKHMVMFGEFCNRYLGKVYPDKKIALTTPKYAKGEEEVTFYCKVMTVEELGDYYNVAIQTDTRVDGLVREVNRVHHIDEARHLAFGRKHTEGLFKEYSPKWSDETMAQFRGWVVEYLKSCWGDYYNPKMYQDAGLENAYDVRTMAMAHEACVAHRKKASAKLIKFFLDTGILAEEPLL